MIASGFFKNFTKNLGIELAVDITRGFLNHRIKDLSADDVHRAIKENINLWENIPPDIKSRGRALAERFSDLADKHRKKITTPLVLEWLEHDRPDILSIIINTEEGYLWLDNQVKTIKEEIWGDTHQ